MKRRKVSAMAAGLLIAGFGAPALADPLRSTKVPEPAPMAAPCLPRAQLDALPSRPRQGEAGAIASFPAAPACQHWITLFYAVGAMFKAGQRDGAAKWFYVAQIRGRLVMALTPTSSTPAMIGAPINGYAGGDQTKWVAGVDAAIAWDVANPITLEGVVTVGQSTGGGGTMISGDPRAPIVFETPAPRPTRSAFDAAHVRHRRGIADLRHDRRDRPRRIEADAPGGGPGIGVQTPSPFARPLAHC